MATCKKTITTTPPQLSAAKGRYGCSGSLVSGHAVLTAAHCFAVDFLPTRGFLAEPNRGKEKTLSGGDEKILYLEQSNSDKHMQKKNPDCFTFLLFIKHKFA